MNSGNLNQALELRHRVEQFLFHEARLLDDNQWEHWLELFEPQGMYWVPRTRGQTDTRGHISLFWEDAMLRNVRVRRLRNPRNWSQQPPTRSVRIIGNVSLSGGADDALTVRSSFHMLDFRAEDQRAFGGWYTHTLKPDPLADGGFSIRMKRVDLLNCDAVHENLQVFF